MKRRNILFALVACAGALTACGGGTSGPAADGSSAERSQAEPVHGFVNIEERSGKRVLDAWFARGPAAIVDGEPVWQSGDDSCVQRTTMEPAQAARWQDTLYAGESIVIQSRAEHVVSLLPQYDGQAVVYATEERWLSDPLPDDAYLSVPGAGDIPAFGPVWLSPLTPLLVLQPVDGVSLDSAQPVLWEASAQTDDGIELTVSTMAPENAIINPVFRCTLTDNGNFSLPAALTERMPMGSALVYTMVRTRTASLEAEGAYLHLSQSSFH